MDKRTISQRPYWDFGILYENDGDQICWIAVWVVPIYLVLWTIESRKERNTWLLAPALSVRLDQNEAESNPAHSLIALMPMAAETLEYAQRPVEHHNHRLFVIFISLQSITPSMNFHRPKKKKNSQILSASEFGVH